jgi:leader peptidase (prepilin peptidase)/N-methyltransferase
VLALKILIFTFGAVVGSFLNVVIHRMPLGRSVVSPRSSCPSCGHMIKWYENIPVLSYLIILRGKCSSCSVRIPIRYPLIELLVGFIALFLFPSSLDFMSAHSMYEFFFYFSIACVFLAHFIIDIEHHLLLDKLNIYLLFVIIPYMFLNSSLFHWMWGGIFGFGATYFVTWIFFKWKGQVGLGGGDIKLFGILGILFGVQGVLHTIFLSSFLGSIIGVVLIASKKMNKQTHLAFGPYIILVAAVQLYFPEIFEIVNFFNLK